jgi:hypothetical protein
MPAKEGHSDGFVAALTQLFALYVVYVFLSGWTFFDYYFREFGINPRWLDLPVQEILVKGFTVLLTGGYWLWPIYLAMIVVPLAVDRLPALHERPVVRIAVGCFLFVALFGVYFASRRAGSTEAAIDKGQNTSLPVIIFSLRSCAAVVSTTTGACDFTGDVLAVRGGVYYLHKVAVVGQQPMSAIALSVFRVEDLTNVRIVEH